MAKHGRKASADSASPPAGAGAPAAKKDLLRAPARRRADKSLVEIEGLVVDVFGRRFTLEADGARSLVDLGRRGAALVAIAPGARLVLAGRRKNGEFKAFALREAGEPRLRALRKEKHVKKLAAAGLATAPGAGKAAPSPPV